MNVAINGFGRIGRAAFKIALEKNVNVVAINDLTDNKTLAHLLKYDTVYGKFDKEIESTEDSLIVDGKPIKAFSEKDPANLPWRELEIDVVLECTGVFTTAEKSAAHIKAGAQKVIISAPAKDDTTGTYLIGVNQDKYDGAQIISNASCTTNCIAPVAKVLNDVFGVKKALMTTIHAYTANQNLVDGPNKDLRRARSAASNIVPTTTGAAIATTKTIPELEGLFDGMSVRVPVAIGSLSDFTFVLNKDVTVEEVNEALVKACDDPTYKEILMCTDEPIVSSDIIGNTYSSIVDLSLTKVVAGDLVKVVAWYDNEIGYSHRLIEMAQEISKK